jgi:hypothetical protein
MTKPHDKEACLMSEPVGQLNLKARSLALIVGGGTLAGALVVLGAILPAEFNVDPLGLGKLTGVSRLWAPDEKAFEGGGRAAYASTTPIQRTLFEIPLGAEGWKEAELEFKVAMSEGQAMLYRWEVVAQAGGAVAPVEFDFHGHTLTEGDEAMTVGDYRKDRAQSDTGALSAPFDGIHGWYFKNHSADPVTIRLEVEGFYTLIPPGEPGNEFRIRPVETGPAP